MHHDTLYKGNFMRLFMVLSSRRIVVPNLCNDITPLPNEN